MMTFAEGSSMSGTMFTDVISVQGGPAPGNGSGATATNFSIGALTSVTGLLTSGVASIFGLGIPAASKQFSVSSPTGALAAAGAIPSPTFALCLTGPSSGGSLTLGGMLPDINTSPVQWLPWIGPGVFYSASLTAAWVGKTSVVPSAPATVVVDVATTLTYLPTGTFNAVLGGAIAFCATPGACVGTPINVPREQLCYSLSSPAALSTFPGVTLYLAGFNSDTSLGNATVAMPASSVWLAMAYNKGAYCFSLYDSGVSGSAVMGANALMGYNVAFATNATGYAIGFANATCSS
jgi:hypothetical protein